MIEAERARTIDAERMVRPMRISQEVFFETGKVHILNTTVRATRRVAFMSRTIYVERYNVDVKRKDSE